MCGRQLASAPSAMRTLDGTLILACWVMSALDETVIINRRRREDTYVVCPAEARLPD